MLPREDLLPDTAIFAGHQTISLSDSTDLEPGDLLGTSLSLLLQVLLTTLGHPSLNPPAPPLTPGVHALHDNIPVAKESSSPAYPEPPPKAPCLQVLARLDADQQIGFLDLWGRLPSNLRDVIFNLHGSGSSPSVIDNLGGVPCEFQDVLSTSTIDFGSCSLIIRCRSISLHPRTAHRSPPARKGSTVSLPRRSTPSSTKIPGCQLDPHSTSPYSNLMVVIPKQDGELGIQSTSRR